MLTLATLPFFNVFKSCSNLNRIHALCGGAADAEDEAWRTVFNEDTAGHTLQIFKQGCHREKMMKFL